LRGLALGRERRDAAVLGCAAAALVAQGLGTDHGDFDLAAVEQAAAEGRAGGRLGRNPLGRAAR
jgi:hypothetical protein